jgi:hypothetical protein
MDYVGIEGSAGMERPQEVAEGTLAVGVDEFLGEHSNKIILCTALQRAGGRVGSQHAPGFLVGDDQTIRGAFKDILIQLPGF